MYEMANLKKFKKLGYPLDHFVNGLLAGGMD